ncbi:MAG: MerR family transcriptional regulator [Pseudomonadota bacterium]
MKSRTIAYAASDSAGRVVIAERSATGGGSGASGSGSSSPSGMASDFEVGGLFSDRDLRTIENENSEGLTSVQIVSILTDRGIRFSEATFRKYVQLGLLPRSRRVGRKGKHQGSLGLYPATTVRRIAVIKRLMSENYTIDDIQRRFLRFRDEIEALERGLSRVFSSFDEEIRAARFDTHARRDLKREITEARKAADDLLKRIERIENRVSEPRERLAGAGVPGGAEDLL